MLMELLFWRKPAGSHQQQIYKWFSLQIWEDVCRTYRIVTCLVKNHKSVTEQLTSNTVSVQISLTLWTLNPGTASSCSAVWTRAVQLIEFDSHAHLVSKAGSVIGAKSPSPVFKLSAVNTQSRSSLTSFAFIIEFDSSAIMNAISRSLSVNYGIIQVWNGMRVSKWFSFFGKRSNGSSNSVSLRVGTTCLSSQWLTGSGTLLHVECNFIWWQWRHRNNFLEAQSEVCNLKCCRQTQTMKFARLSFKASYSSTGARAFPVEGKNRTHN